MTQHVNWVLTADLRKFFHSVDHGCLLRMVSYRISDLRVLRLIAPWLRAGVIERGEWHETTAGTPQGAYDAQHREQLIRRLRHRASKMGFALVDPQT